MDVERKLKRLESRLPPKIPEMSKEEKLERINRLLELMTCDRKEEELSDKEKLLKIRLENTKKWLLQELEHTPLE
jgi:hypothetical protein